MKKPTVTRDGDDTLIEDGNGFCLRLNRREALSLSLDLQYESRVSCPSIIDNEDYEFCKLIEQDAISFYDTYRGDRHLLVSRYERPSGEEFLRISAPEEYSTINAIHPFALQLAWKFVLPISEILTEMAKGRRPPGKRMIHKKAWVHHSAGVTNNVKN